jgi:hypothetical protein
MLSNHWKGDASQVNGDLFIDADPILFEHILNLLRRSIPLIFWTRTNVFDYPLYAALHREAQYFGIGTLEQWIAEQKYLGSIAISQSIQQVDLSHCIQHVQNSLTSFSDDTEKYFDPNE